MKKKLFTITIMTMLAILLTVPSYADVVPAVSPNRDPITNLGKPQKNGLYKVGKKSAFFKDGKMQKITGLVKNNRTGQWVYVKKGIFKKVTGVVPGYDSKKEYYVKNGVFKKSTGLVKNLTTGKLVYVEKGVFDKEHTGCVKKLTDNKYYYVKKGRFTKWTGYSTDPKGHIMHVVKGVAKTHKHKWGSAKYLTGYESTHYPDIMIHICNTCGKRFRDAEKYDQHNQEILHGGFHVDWEGNPKNVMVPVYTYYEDIYMCSLCKAELDCRPEYEISGSFEESDGTMWYYTVSKNNPKHFGDGAARGGVTKAKIKNAEQIRNNNW